MKKSRFLAVTAASLMLTVASAVTSLAATGWQAEGNNWRYYKADGSAAVNQWVKSGDYWYWIGSNGIMGTNMWINNQEKWYYVGEDGASVKKWKQISGKWYFFYDDFTMASNTTIDSYRLGKTGAMIE